MTWHECAEFGRAATPSYDREVSTRVLTKQRNSLQHSLTFRPGLNSMRVPSRSPATKKRTESCSSTPTFLNCLFELHMTNRFFSTVHVKYPRSPQNAPKKFGSAAPFETQTNPKLSLDPGLLGIPTLKSGIFSCGEKLHQSTNLLTFKRLHHCICRTIVPCSGGIGKCMDFWPTYAVASGPQALKVHIILFFFRFFGQSHARWMRNKEFTWCSLNFMLPVAVRMKHFVYCKTISVHVKFKVHRTNKTHFLGGRVGTMCYLLDTR